MKNSLFLGLVLLVLSACSDTDKDRASILNTLETQRQAWNKGDLETFMQGYWKSDSLLFVSSDGPTYGYDQTLENYKKTYPDKDAMGELIFGIKKVEFLSKDAAFVLGSWSLKRATDNPKGYYTLIFRKIDGVWKMVSDHSS